MHVVNVQKLLRVHITLLDMKKHTLGKHFVKVSNVLSPALYIKGLIWVRNLSAINMGKLLMRHLPPLNIRELMQERNLMSAINVEETSGESHTFLFTREFIQERNPFSVINVEKHLAKNQTLEYIRELTVGKNLMNGMNMENCLRNQL